jgi:dUTP pyrophosphatase
VKIVLDKGAFVPERAHATDAGLDLKTPEAFILRGGDAVVIDTGVHVELPKGTVGMLKSKSGLNVKHGITSEGVIDEGYTGSIRAKLYNNGNETINFYAGDKITQLVILPVLTPDIEIVDSLEETERGNGGFGSTGR